MGFGFGGMLLGTAGAKMIAAIGWRTTFMIFGIAFGVIVLICMLLLKTAPQEFVDSLATDPKKVVPPVEELKPAQMLKKRNFWIYFCWAIVLSAAGLAIINDAAPFAQTVIGDDLTKAAAIAGIISIFNGAGRVLVGLIYDKFNYRVTMILTDLLFMLSAVALIGCYRSHSYVLLITAFVLIGTSYGFIPPTNSAYIAYFFGRQNYGVNFSLINMNLIAASYLGPLCGGGDYMRSFYFIIGFAVIGFVLTMMIKKPEGK
jgi:OFA family oxalate/formate antiporter-like MFS transporter